MDMTPEQAQAALNSFFQELGLPHSEPFVGDIWKRTTAALAKLVKDHGADNVKAMFSQAIDEAAVVAQQPPAG